MTDPARVCCMCGRQGHLAQACPWRGWANHLPPTQAREHLTREQLADRLDRAGIAHNLRTP